MKKFGKFILLFFIVTLYAFINIGCPERQLPTQTPTALVILVGNHSNSKKLDVPLQEKIKEVYSNFGNICVIVIDGDPSVVRDENNNMVGYYDSEYIKRSKDDYKYKDIWERDYLNPQIEILKKQLNNIRAKTPEVDTLKALQIAAELLNFMEVSMGSEIKKEILIYDTGLCTSGTLNFLNPEHYKYIKNNIRIWENDKKIEEVKELIDELDNKMEIPSLSDVIITWYGLGKVDAPQSKLSNLSINNLQYVWGEILNRTKVTSSNIGGTDAKYGIFVSLNSDESITGSPMVTPIFLWDIEGEEDTEAQSDIESESYIEETIPILTEEDLGFLPNSDEYRSEKDAHSVLQPYANNLQNYPNMRILLVGTTADPNRNGGSILLSEQRAKKVKDTLIALGISEDRIDIIGLGANSPWYENEWENGYFDESIAKRNRVVRIIPRNSKKAIQIMGDN